MASQYRYVRPVIDEDAPKSYFNVKNLRHVLIEQLVKQELYVTNDVCLGKRSDSDPCTPDGILLYGTNAVGKTSMIRACGVAIIMAQAGMYVPCTEFVYKPYKSIFSRILSNDNLFKGLSTFAVEMSELRVILNNADENSFVLGDELCSGTETESAISIVMAALEELHRKNCTLLFATHFHELVDYAELKSLSRMQLKHLAVFYDREADCLIYDRKIRDGPGKRTYGLEVCKSLYLPDDFIERAFTIRKTHFEENKGTLEYKVSHFNSKKIKGKCEMCGKYSKTNEIHHLQEQHLADEAGYIDGVFHKDHIGNLITVCEECHDRFHGKGDHASIVYEEDAMSRLTGDVDEDSPNETNTVHTKRVIRRKKTNKGYKLIEQFV
jgi:DNA mismatch repair protein MutS